MTVDSICLWSWLGQGMTIPMWLNYLSIHLPTKPLSQLSSDQSSNNPSIHPSIDPDQASLIRPSGQPLTASLTSLPLICLPSSLHCAWPVVGMGEAEMNNTMSLPSEGLQSSEKDEEMNFHYNIVRWVLTVEVKPRALRDTHPARVSGKQWEEAPERANIGPEC